LYTQYLGDVFTIITYLGSAVFWVLMIVIFWLKGRRKVSLALVYSLIINTVLLIVLKFSFDRARPFQLFDLGFTVNNGPSFPSGHTELAFSGAYILSKYYRKYTVALYALSFLVAFSRIYLGLHFPLDTLIGAINGIIV